MQARVDATGADAGRMALLKAIGMPQT